MWQVLPVAVLRTSYAVSRGMWCTSLWPWVSHKLSRALLHNVIRVWGGAALWHSFQLQLVVSLFGELLSLHRWFCLNSDQMFVSEPLLWIFSAKKNKILYLMVWIEVLTVFMYLSFWDWSDSGYAYVQWLHPDMPLTFSEVILQPSWFEKQSNTNKA